MPNRRASRLGGAGYSWRSRPRQGEQAGASGASGSSTSTTQPCGAGASPARGGRRRGSPARRARRGSRPRGGRPTPRRPPRPSDATEIDRTPGGSRTADTSWSSSSRRSPVRSRSVGVVATGAGDRVEVAVVAGGLERGEHRRVVAATGVVPGVDRAREQPERALRQHDGRPARFVELAELARRTEPRPGASHTSSASAASAPRLAIAPSPAPSASTSTSVPIARKRAGAARCAPFTGKQYETPRARVRRGPSPGATDRHARASACHLARAGCA